MKLIRSVSLEYREGTSDKVYEVDLCEVGPDQFVVNFRYGRRGSTLRDGSKTPISVSEQDAIAIFGKLVKSKTDKGYRNPSVAVPTSTESVSESESDDQAGRRERILQRLTEGNNSESNWPLSRAVWRCGELKLADAEPILIALAGSGDAMLDYCIAWSLGQCGNSTSVELLTNFEANHESPTVRRIAGVSLLEVLEGAKYSNAIQECVEQLPESLRQLAVDGPAEAFRDELSRVLVSMGDEASGLIEIVYLINNEHVRPALLDFLQSARLAPGHFHRVRHVFKAAELRRDAEVFGLIARRFEVSQARFTMHGRWYYPKRKLPTLGQNPSQAFSTQTRRYLRKRVWRTLRRFAYLGDSATYVNMAAGVLQFMLDEDARPPRSDTRYQYNSDTNRWNPVTTQYDRFSDYLAFNQILFGNSSRYEVDAGKGHFKCIPPFVPGGAETTDREEAYPEFWDRHPNVVVDLLSVSRCEIVHRFGVKVLKAAADFCQQLEVDALTILLGSTYEVTVQFAFELAVNRYDAADPDFELVMALAHCNYQPGREQAYGWIDADRLKFLSQSEFVFGLVTGPQADTRTFARDSLRSVSLPDDDSRALVGRLMSFLTQLEDEDGELAADVVETLLVVFGHLLQQVSEAVIRDLLTHALPEVQRFAGDLVLRHDQFAQHPPDDVIRLLLESDNDSVRGIGVRIIGQLSDSILKTSIELLIGLTRHEKPDIREAIRSTVVRLCESDRAFGEQIGRRLIEALLIPGAPEGVPSHTSRVLREDLASCLGGIEADLVWRLLYSRSGPAQEVGGSLLPTNIESSEISLDEIARLSNHEILTVRESSWQLCRDNLERIKSEPDVIARIADARWEDSRKFAFEFIKQNFLEDEILSPTVLVSICDSVKEEVQQFGRELISRLFQEGHGEEYVTKLSEHPAEAMQLFASNFLQQHASDNPEQLSSLAPNFVSVLSRVNKGRIAKARALQLLHTEGLKSEEAARTACGILSRISGTVAISDRVSAIEILLSIQSKWPNVETPLTVKPLEVRNGV